jgi:hypothetical protein
MLSKAFLLALVIILRAGAHPPWHEGVVGYEGELVLAASVQEIKPYLTAESA